MKQFFFFLFLLGILFNVQAHEKEGERSFIFIENKGQWPDQVQYKAEIENTVIYFESNAFHYQFFSYPDYHLGNQPEDTLVRKHIFEAQFIGSNSEVQTSKKGKSDYYYNYFLGNDESKWKGDVHLFEEIVYHNLYNGIDLEVYQQQGFLKYDYHVSPGVDPSLIRINFDGVATPIIENGELIVEHSLGKLIEEKPYAYQIINGEKVEVLCNFHLNKQGIVSFKFPESYDKSVELIIDPVLVFSTYSGSTANNFGQTATYDKNEAGYMGGIAFGTGYSTTLGAYQSVFRGGNVDIAISKFSPDGQNLVYSTYIGGSRNETAHSLVVDDSLNLYMLGVSSSINYPTRINAVDRFKDSSFSIQTDISTSFVDGTDIIVTKFNSTGTAILGSTYFGGNGIDGINFTLGGYADLGFNYGDSHRGEIVLDSMGNCYIGTSTTSSNINTTFDSYHGSQDGLIVKFGTNLDTVIWSRYFGGMGKDAIYSLKVIDNDKILIGGGTKSTDFPTTPGAYKETLQGGIADGFIAIISPDGSTIEKNTIIGTVNYDQVYFVEFDRFNNVYGYGQSEGGLFPLKNAPVADTLAGQFFIKMDANLDSLIFSTTFGQGFGNGTINISPTAFLVDRCQNLYASGWGGSIVAGEGSKRLPANMPVVNSDPMFAQTDTNDFYLYVLNRNADSVLYASYFGGTISDDHVDGGTSRFDKNGIIYQSICASCGPSTTDFPTTPTAYATRDLSSNGCNNALFKFDFQILPEANFSVSKRTFCYNDTLPDSLKTIQIIDLSEGANNKLTWDLNGRVVDTIFDTLNYVIQQAGSYRFRQIVRDTICAAGDFLEIVVEARPDNIQMTTFFDTVVCLTDSATVFANTNGNINRFSWSDQADFSTILNTSPDDSSFSFKLQQGINKFYVMGENTITNACEKIDSAIISYFPTFASVTFNTDTVCQDKTVQLRAFITNVDTFTWRFGNGVTNSLITDPTTTYPAGGDYTISFEYENKRCDEKDSLLFDLYVQANDFSFSSPVDTLFCGTGNFDVSLAVSGSIEQYQWSSTSSFLDTLNSSLQQNLFSINNSDSSTYYLKVSNRFCEKFDSITTQYINYDLQLASIIDSVCTPFNTQLNTVIIGTDSFRINYGNGLTTTTNPTPLISYITEGVYPIQLIGSNARCNKRDTISELINVFKGVEIDPLFDTLICLGDTIQLIANSGGTAQQFIWDESPNFQTPLNNVSDSSVLVFPTVNTAYYFKAENIFCDAVDTLEVSTEEVDVDVDDILSICIEDSLDIEAIVNLASTPLNFMWSPDTSVISGQNTRNIIVAPKNDLTLSLLTTSTTGCIDRDTVEIEVNIPAFTDAEILAAENSLFVGQSTQLSTNRNGSNLLYKWEPAAGLNNPQLPNPQLTADQSRTYKVTITDINTGCEVIAFKRLIVFEINCDEPDIFVPTAFTPNSDLSNDILYVRGANLAEINFQLFNRWGELVFETNDKNIGWDGRYKGKNVNPGVFTYQLRATCFDGQEYYKKGNITLIR